MNKEIEIVYLDETKKIDTKGMLSVHFKFDDYELSVDFNDHENALNIHIPGHGMISVIPRAANYIIVKKVKE